MKNTIGTVLNPTAFTASVLDAPSFEKSTIQKDQGEECRLLVLLSISNSLALPRGKTLQNSCHNFNPDPVGR